MKANFITRKSLLFIFILTLISAIPASAQGIFERIKEKAKTATTEVTSKSSGATAAASSIRWARFEVRASWKENGGFRTAYETRVYYSDIKTLNLSSTESQRIEQSVMKYFDEGIGNQLKARGIDIKYYDSDVQVYPLTTPYESRAEAEEQMKKRMEADRSNEYAIYTFTWKYGAAASEEVSQPKRIFARKSAPAVENTKIDAAKIGNADAQAKSENESTQKRDAENAQSQKLIWGYAVLKVRVKDSRGKEFNRTYVSEIAPVSRTDYNAFYNTDERFIKPRIWEYFAATVAKAARERGEEIEEPYDASIEYKFSLDRDADLKPVFRPQSVLNEPREREISYAKQSSRPVFFFRWDAGGKNAEVDFQKEKTRGASTNLPN